MNRRPGGSRLLTRALGAALAVVTVGVPALALPSAAEPTLEATSQETADTTSPAAAVAAAGNVLVNPSFEQPGTNGAEATNWTPVLLENEASPYNFDAVVFNSSGQYPPPAPVPDGQFALEMFWQVGSNLGVLGVAAEQTAATFGVVDETNADVFSYDTVQTFYANSSVVNWAGSLAEVEFTSGGQTNKLRYFHSNSGSYRGQPQDAGNVRYIIGEQFPGSRTWIHGEHDLAADIQAEFGITDFAVTAVRVGNLQDRTGTNPFSNMTSYWDNIGLVVGETSDTTPPAVDELVPNDGATDAATDTAVSVAFDEPVRAGDPAAEVTITAGDTTVGGVTASASGNTLTIAHDELAEGTEYTVTVPAGAAIDEAGNATAEAITWTFTTEGDTGPEPGTNVLVNAGFEEPGMPLQPTGWAPVLLEGETTPTAFEIFSYPHSGGESPSIGLSMEVLWDAQIGTGVKGTAAEQTAATFGVVDQDNVRTLGYAMGESATPTPSRANWAGSIAEVEFTSGDATHKLRYYHERSWDYAGEPQDPADGSVKYLIGDKFASITSWVVAEHDLAADIEAKFGVTEFTVQAVRFGNLNDRTDPDTQMIMNTFVDNVSLTVVGGDPGDITPPVVTASEPANGATGVATDAAVSVTFDEAVVAGDTIGDVAIAAGSTAVGGVVATANGNTLTIAHNELAEGTEYTVTVPAGAVADAAGNATTTATNWSFTTAEGGEPSQGLVNPSFELPGENGAIPTGWTPVLLENEASPYNFVAATFNSSGQYPPPNPIPDGQFGLEMFWQVGSNLGVMGTAVEQSAAEFGTVNQDTVGNFGYSAVQTFYANSSVVNWAGGLAEVEFTSGGQTYTLRYFHSNSGSYRGQPQDAGNVRYIVGQPFPGNNSWITANHDLAGDIQAKFGLSEFTVDAVRVGNLQDRTGTNPFSNMTTYWDALDLEVIGDENDTTPPTLSSTRPVNGATDVQTNATVSATFSEVVRAGSTIGNVTVTSGGATVPGVTATASGNTLTIAHNAFAAHTPYTVTVPAGAVTDRSGNALVAPITWSFTTGEPAPDYTLINAVQGAGVSSPITGQTVTIQGVVVGIDDEVGADYDRTYPEDRGIFVQSLARDIDDNPNTSEAIFVGFVDRPSNYQLGDVVRVTGQVKEKFALTEIAEQIGQEPQKVGVAPVPTPVTIDQARAESQGAGRAYYESLENMRVHLPVATLNSGGTNKFGETFVTVGTTRDEFVFGESTPPSLLALDADAGAGNPANPYKPPAPSTTYTTADHFDQVQDAVGPLSFSYSHYKLMPQPGNLPTVVDGPTVFPYPGPTPAEPGQLRIVSYNVLNYFPAGGFNDLSVVTQAEYTKKRDRIAHAIGELLDRPDVVALQEVVNLAIIQDLANQLGGYTAYLIEGSDSRGIDQGYLIKDTVTASNLRQLGATAGGCDDSGRLYDRPPLAIDITAGDLTVTVINNHYKSKSGPDSCRDAQSTYQRGQVAALEAAGKHVVVTGDLNSFETDNAIRILETGSTLTNLWSRSPDGTRFSNHYQGQLQTLDHTLITDGLEERFVDFVYSPISSNYADRFDDGHKIADHNPMILTLQAAPADACPDGYSPEENVVFGGVDSGVANVDRGDGCTILDLVWAEGPFASHSQFIRHVSSVVAEFRADGLITARQASEINRAANRSSVGETD